MKKLIVLFAMTAVFFSGCALNGTPDIETSGASATAPIITVTPEITQTPVPTEFVPWPLDPPELSQETIDRINKTTVGIALGQVYTTSPPRPDDYKYRYEAYLGTYNGCVVLYLGESPYGWGDFIGPIGMGYALLIAWKDDVFYDTIEAYRLGLLTEADGMNAAYHYDVYMSNKK